MHDLPPEFDPIRRMLQEAVDRQIEAQHQRLEDERREKHSEIDRFFKGFWRDLNLASVAAEAAMKAAPLPHLKRNGHSDRRVQFALRDAIGQIIRSLPDGATIDQPFLYSRLTADHPVLRERPEANLRGQISGILKKLAKEELLMLHRKGSGSKPDIYVKTALWAAEQADDVEGF
jgi:hypothetical protein